jgi:adenosylcobinamide kinase/adenosylcobinamide-phosphate guanylyltransferase
MKIFLSGGCKNGKSYYALHLAKAQWLRSRASCLYYIATMNPADAEDEERILRHRRERDGWNFITVEQPVDIEKILDKCGHSSSFLLDSLTALLANEMFLPDDSINAHAAEKTANGLSRIMDSVNDIVIVSDYIYCDALEYEPLTETYRASLAKIDQAAAKNCDVVLEIAYANAIVHKGKEMLGGLYDKIL